MNKKDLRDIIPIMETFECDPQRLAKLDRRFGGAQGAPDNQVPPQQHQVETSESDNSQNEAIQVDSTSQEIKGNDSKKTRLIRQP